MAKFVMGSQKPAEFRKCQLDYDQSEFNDGKKKNFIITLNSMQINPEENLYQQQFYQGQSKLNHAGKQLQKMNKQMNNFVELDNISQEQAQDKFGMSKLQLKQFSKQCVALKVGIAKNREYGIVVPYEKSPVRQITSAKTARNKEQKKIAFQKLQIDTDIEEDDTNMDFFSYLQLQNTIINLQIRDLTTRPQSAKISSGPQFRGKKQYFVEADRLDRIEADSQSQIMKKTMAEKTLKEQYEERKKEKANNSIAMNQHPTGHAKTDAGEKYMQFLQEYLKNKPNFKKFNIVKRGNKGQMSSMYPPMFERARLTKKLYYQTTYKNYYQLPQQNYMKAGGKFGTSEFRQTYRPILFNAC